MSDIYGTDYPNPLDPGPADNPNHVGLSWQDVDLTDVVAGIVDGTLVRPTPTILCLTDGTGLLYPGKVHGVHGIGGCGKTWLAAVALAERISRGQHVVLIDLEDTAATIVERLVVDLRVDPEAVLEFLHYIRPTEPARHGTARLHATVLEHQVTLVVLDSTGEALANDGVKQNEDHEVARWMRLVARSIADLGPAVLLLDHVPKSDEKTLMPIGSQRKQAAMNGAIYSMQMAQPFSRDTAGWAKVVCGKDRQGTYTRERVVAELRLTPTGEGRTDVKLVAHKPSTNPDGSFRPTTLMEKASRRLETANEPLSSNKVVTGLGQKAAAITALDILVAEGYVKREHGPRSAQLHTTIKPYRQTDDTGNQSSGPATATGSGSLRLEPENQSSHQFPEPVGTSRNQSCPLHPDEAKPDACHTCEQVAAR